MSATHSFNLEVYNAIRFRDSISGPDSANVFFTIGKSTDWPDDNNPPNPDTSVRTFNDIWSNMIGGKRITTNDTNLCILRYNWAADSVYEQYDDALDDRSQAYNPYYVVTDEWNVYKCIYNNNGNTSTVKPTSTSTSGFFTTADGYVWKYMYTVSSSDRLRFTTESFIPISLSQYVINSAQPGQISSIVVENSGDNYTNTLSITITGDGYGARAYPVWDDANNNLLKVIVTDHGTGYTYANAYITAATGSNANVRVILSPAGGHGSDPYTELAAGYVIINPQIKYDEGGKLITGNDYRQISLIEGPHLYGTTTQSSNSVFNQTMIMAVTGISAEFQNDERVYQGVDLPTSTFKAIVSKWDSANGIIHLTNTEGTPKNDVLVGDTSSARKFVTSIVYPDMASRSGRLLYTGNISPVARAMDQTDSFQIVLSF